jgi:hypothetical protein
MGIYIYIKGLKIFNWDFVMFFKQKINDHENNVKVKQKN